MNEISDDKNVEQQNENIKRPGGLYGTRHTQVILTFLALAIAYAMRVNLSTAIVAMTTKTSDNPTVPIYDWKDTSTVLSSFFWGYILLQVFAGKLGELYGPRWLVLASILVNSVVCIATPAIAASLGSYGVMGCRFLQGLFQGFIFPSAHNMLRRWAPPDERSKMGTLVFSGSALGTMLAAPITSAISGTWAGWPASFYVFGGIGLLFCVLWIALQSDSPAVHQRIGREERYYIEASLGQIEKIEIGTPWRAIFTSMPMWAVIVGNFGQNWGYATLLTEIPNYMNSALGYDMAKNGVLSAAPYFVLFIMCFVVGPLSDFIINRAYFSRGTVRKIFNTVGTCVPAVALFALGFSDNAALSVALLVVAVGVNAAVFCGFQVNHIDLAPNHAGTLMGITNGSSNIFSIIAPLMVQAIVDPLTDKALWRIIFIVAAGVYVASAFFYIIFASGEIQPWNAPDFLEKEKQAREANSGDKRNSSNNAT